MGKRVARHLRFRCRRCFEIRSAGRELYLVKPDTLPGLKDLLKKIHEYWIECEVPQVDAKGCAVETDSRGRLGARYAKPKRQKP
jgi:hypothetical protein